MFAPVVRSSSPNCRRSLFHRARTCFFLREGGGGKSIGYGIWMDFQAESLILNFKRYLKGTKIE